MVKNLNVKTLISLPTTVHRLIKRIKPIGVAFTDDKDKVYLLASISLERVCCWRERRFLCSIFLCCSREAAFLILLLLSSELPFVASLAWCLKQYRNKNVFIVLLTFPSFTLNGIYFFTQGKLCPANATLKFKSVKINHICLICKS